MRRAIVSVIVVIAIAGCTIHPPGEKQERAAAIREGRPYEKPATKRISSPLPATVGPDDLVRYALLTSPEVEQRYWDWRSAIEQIPQAGTQQTNLAISLGTIINSGRLSRETSTVSLGNDPMADIVLPPKLSVAAKRSLEDARAAGIRFQKAKFELRQKVLDAYYEYANQSELIRLERQNAALLRSTLTITEARNQAGAGSQQDILKARNELDMSANNIQKMESDQKSQVALINTLLNRQPNAAITLRTPAPQRELPKMTDAELLDVAGKSNLELKALAAELRSRNLSIEQARLQRLPDFSVNIGTDLAGMAQNLLGMISLPILRHEAIDAAIVQARANLLSTQAMIQQTSNDLRARVVMDLIVLRDTDRQLDLFTQKVLPRARQAVALSQSSYESGQSQFIDLLDAQRSIIQLERMVVELRTATLRRMNDLETAINQKLN